MSDRFLDINTAVLGCRCSVCVAFEAQTFECKRATTEKPKTIAADKERAVEEEKKP